jgi:hypothetical protein
MQRLKDKRFSVVGRIQKTYTVTGVFRDPPANSHLRFEMLLPMEDLLKGNDYAHEPEEGWSWNFNLLMKIPSFTKNISLHHLCFLIFLWQKW